MAPTCKYSHFSGFLWALHQSKFVSQKFDLVLCVTPFRVLGTNQFFKIHTISTLAASHVTPFPTLTTDFPTKEPHLS